MTRSISVLLPQQPSDTDGLIKFGELVSSSPLNRLWAGQSFNIESHMALAALASCYPVPVAIGTALAALRTPFDAAMQARSLALLLDQEVSIAYGAADPDFVRSVTGEPLKKPASYTAEYARLVRELVHGRRATSEAPRTHMSAELPPLPQLPIRVGAGVLREGMARKARDHVDFAVSWLTPPAYVDEILLPALTRDDETRPDLATFVACGLQRPGRNAMLLAQRGCPHLRRHHYIDMLQKAGLDVHLSDPASAARELVNQGVFAFGSAASVVDRLETYFDAGVDEVVINITPVALLHGIDEAIEDVAEIVEELQNRGIES